MTSASGNANQPSVASLPQGNGPSATASLYSGRTTDGRFTKGNPGGPGNPFNRQVAALRRALLARVTAEDLEEVLAVLLIKAKGGDLAAIKMLFSYTLGNPYSQYLHCHRWWTLAAQGRRAFLAARVSLF